MTTHNTQHFINIIAHIQPRLKLWRTERGINQQAQLKSIDANLLEETLEYLRANTEYERVDALADMVVFALNAIGDERDMSINNAHSDDSAKSNTNTKDISNIIHTIGHITHHTRDESFNPANHHTTNHIITLLANITLSALAMIESMQYDALLVMNEVITEIESRKGAYDEKLGKWKKYQGVYESELDSITSAAQEKVASGIYANYTLSTTENEYKLLYTKHDGKTMIESYVKWYKADFSKCLTSC